MAMPQEVVAHYVTRYLAIVNRVTGLLFMGLALLIISQAVVDSAANGGEGVNWQNQTIWGRPLLQEVSYLLQLKV